jgi:hypothetical protein
MSVTIINKLLQQFCDDFHFELNTIIVKKMEIEHDNVYKIEIRANNILFSIEHFEPFHMI